SAACLRTRNASLAASQLRLWVLFFWKAEKPCSPTSARLRNTSAASERREECGHHRRKYPARCWSATKKESGRRTILNHRASLLSPHPSPPHPQQPLIVRFPALGRRSGILHIKLDRQLRRRPRYRHAPLHRPRNVDRPPARRLAAARQVHPQRG